MGTEQDPAGVKAMQEARVSPDKGVIEIGSNPTTHPLRKGRIKPAPEEIAETTDPAGQLAIDPVVFKSVSRMDNGE